MKARLLPILLMVLSLHVAVGAGARSQNRLLDDFTLSNESDVETAPRLLDFSGGDVFLTRVSGPMLPNRVYAIYHKQQRAWIYTLTNFSGKFEEPLELLYKGTVLPGAYIGAKNPYENYKLTADYHWIPTKERETHYLIIPARPNILKRVTYTVPPFDMTEWKRPPKE